MKTYHFFVETAEFCSDAYDVNLYYDDEGALEGFECPNCGEPIYYDDFKDSKDTENWLMCPICEEIFVDEC